MAPWLRHPRHESALTALIGRIRAPKYRFRRLEPVIFLCGGAGSSRRDDIHNYLTSHHPALHVFRAEVVWNQIAKRNDRSALQLEADLAALADMVVIVVESPGTFAELGAFALSDDLRKKLLPILEIKHRHKDSFLETGPVRWIDEDSFFRPAIWAPHATILLAVNELQERLKRIPKSKPTTVTDIPANRKHLLFFICDLVALVQPASVELVQALVRRALDDEPAAREVPALLGLALAMKLLSYIEAGAPASGYYRSLPAGLHRPFHRRRFLDLPSERAKYLSVLQLIPEARDLLNTISGLPC
jgi:hypothetical protein